jgi:hypothetical protein
MLPSLTFPALGTPSLTPWWPCASASIVKEPRAFPHITRDSRPNLAHSRTTPAFALEINSKSINRL